MVITSRELSYRDLDTELTGVLCWDEEQTEPRPGLLLIHGGGGLDDHAKGQARRYAALGYTVLAADMFGGGALSDREQIMARITALRDDPELLVRRGRAGLAALAGTAEARGPMGAVGFCFGGMCVLTLARAGLELAAVVSMHGSLGAVAKAGAVRAKVLACHGAQDPHVPMTQVTAFAEEMIAAGVDWQLIAYGNAVHGFTHEHAVPGAIPGIAYDKPTDERSFTAATAFLAESLG